MDLGLEGKSALVAASSRGLGRAAARALAQEGADLTICARGQEKLDRTRDELEEATGVRVIAVPADLATVDGVERVVAAAHEAYGRVDVLLTNAGGPPPGPFEAHDMDAWRGAIRQNLESVLRLTRGVLSGMKERNWGRIINVTSIAVKQPVDGLILSNSVRAAVTGFARTLANEVAAHGVTVNNVLPGYTRTRRLEGLADDIAEDEDIGPDEAMDRWRDEIPMGRIGDPQEFAALVAFLASERASYITGTSIQVDGGWVRSLL